MLVFDLPVSSAALHGDARRFPVRRIYCVGRNYPAHAREMGADPDREAPFFFMKPADALTSERRVPYPPDTDDLQHEVELVVAIGHDGERIDAGNAWAHVFGYGVGVDLTRRDRQNEARGPGRPWERGKAFDQSAPLGPLTPSSATGHMTRAAISLTVNGAVRQRADIADMIWSVPDIIAALSQSWTLHRGDLIYTGTPAGVGPLHRGDEVMAQIEGLQDLRFTIA